MKKTEDDYRAEDDHRTLTRAAEITADPQRLAGVRKHHNRQQQAMQSMNAMLSGTSAETEDDNAPTRTPARMPARPVGVTKVTRGARRAMPRRA